MFIYKYFRFEKEKQMNMSSDKKENIIDIEQDYNDNEIDVRVKSEVEDVKVKTEDKNTNIDEDEDHRDQQHRRRRERGPRSRRRHKPHHHQQHNRDQGDQQSPPPAKTVSMKNAVMMLNEMFPPPDAPQYKVISMHGSPNNPTFEMVCTILEQSFTGSGRSKKEAKLAASQLALEKLFGKDFSTGSAETRDLSSQPCQRSLSEIDAWMELEGKVGTKTLSSNTTLQF